MNRHKSKTIALVATSAVLLSVIRARPTDGGGNDCSGQKAKPCATAVSAADGCEFFTTPGSFDSCEGEVLLAPYTSALTAGVPSNNMRESYNFAVCAYRYDCDEGASSSGCVKGDLLGRSFGKEIINGGTCEVP